MISRDSLTTESVAPCQAGLSRGEENSFIFHRLMEEDREHFSGFSHVPDLNPRLDVSRKYATI